MTECPPTRPSLLVRIRDARDGEAWRQFVELYAPLVYGFARKRGLQDADAADLTQDVLRAVARGVGRLGLRPAPGHVPRLAVHRRPQQAAQLPERRGTQPGRAAATAAPMPARRAARPARTARTRLGREYERRLFAWAAEQVRGDVPADRPGRRSGRPPSRASRPARWPRALGLTVGGRLRRQEPGAGPAARTRSARRTGELRTFPVFPG